VLKAAEYRQIKERREIFRDSMAFG